MYSLDRYSLLARLLPSLLAIAPAFALAATWVLNTGFNLPTTIASVAIVGLFYAFSEVGRRAGTRIERVIFTESGGRPPFDALRRFPSSIPSERKDVYREFLAAQIELPVPGVRKERDNPRSVDGFYQSCSLWLRERTRHDPRFTILLNDNISYGFRRNLLGMRPPALLANILVVLLCAFLLVLQGLFPGEPTIGLLILVLVVAGVHAGFFLLWVNKAGMLEASDVYERQLALCCETLMDDRKVAAA